MRYTTLIRMLVLSMLTTTLFAADDPGEAPKAFVHLRQLETTDGKSLIVDQQLITAPAEFAGISAKEAQERILATGFALLVRYLAADAPDGANTVSFYLHSSIIKHLHELKSLSHQPLEDDEPLVRRAEYHQGVDVPSIGEFSLVLDCAAFLAAGHTVYPHKATEAALKFAQGLGASPECFTALATQCMAAAYPMSPGVPVVVFSGPVDTPDKHGSVTLAEHKKLLAGGRMKPTRITIVDRKETEDGDYEYYYTNQPGALNLNAIADAFNARYGADSAKAAVGLFVDGTKIGTLGGLERFPNLVRLSAYDCGLVAPIAPNTFTQPLKVINLGGNEFIAFNFNAFNSAATTTSYNIAGEPVEVPVLSVLESVFFDHSEKIMELTFDGAVALETVSLEGCPMRAMTSDTFRAARIRVLTMDARHINLEEQFAAGTFQPFADEQRRQMIAAAERVWNDNDFLQKTFPMPADGDKDALFVSNFKAILEAYIRNFILTMELPPGDEGLAKSRERMREDTPLSHREVVDFVARHAPIDGVLSQNTLVKLSFVNTTKADAALLAAKNADPALCGVAIQ